MGPCEYNKDCRACTCIVSGVSNNSHSRLVNTLTFPFHLRINSRLKCSYGQNQNLPNLFGSWLAQHFKIRAAESEKESRSDKLNGNSNQGSPVTSDSESMIYPVELEMLARAYIEKESGMDRVRNIFKKDHMGKTSPEVDYMQVALFQVFVISFFMKYVPEFRLAKQEFIREHHSTVFRTRLEAVRRMQDQVSLRAGLEGGRFAIKMTGFSAGFLLLSQMIASYRNRTSVWEYSIAAGLTGGLARLKFGIKGFISGSVVGSFLGSIVGAVAFTLFRMYNATQEERHLLDVMALLAVEKSVEGEEAFKEKLEKVRAEHLKQLNAL